MTSCQNSLAFSKAISARYRCKFEKFLVLGFQSRMKNKIHEHKLWEFEYTYRLEGGMWLLLLLASPLLAALVHLLLLALNQSFSWSIIHRQAFFRWYKNLDAMTCLPGRRFKFIWENISMCFGLKKYSRANAITWIYILMSHFSSVNFFLFWLFLLLTFSGVWGKRGEEEEWWIFYEAGFPLFIINFQFNP